MNRMGQGDRLAAVRNVEPAYVSFGSRGPHLSRTRPLHPRRSTRNSDYKFTGLGSYSITSSARGEHSRRQFQADRFKSGARRIAMSSGSGGSVWSPASSPKVFQQKRTFARVQRNSAGQTRDRALCRRRRGLNANDSVARQSG
jgi:hypothetical protein